jgi:hypothetical protein
MRYLIVKLSKLLLVLLTLSIIFPRNAYAYLDPGTSTYLLQLFFALIAGIALFTKTYWHKIKTFLFNLRKRSSKNKKDTITK